MVRAIPNGIIATTLLLLPFTTTTTTTIVTAQRIFSKAMKFTTLPAEDLIQNHLANPTTLPKAQFRNTISTGRSCFALFANGHVAGRNSNADDEYLIPDGGVIMSTGDPFDFYENDSEETTTDFNEDTGEPMLESQLSSSRNGNDGVRVFDHCFIQFEFKCPSSSRYDTPAIQLDYVFGSEEYDAGDNAVKGIAGHNDAFAIFLNGRNIALVSSDYLPVSVSNINAQTNSQYYIPNHLKVGRSIDRTSPHPKIEADGFTTRLRASSAALKEDGSWNKMKLVIGDVGDGELDSWALLEEESFSCVDGSDMLSEEKEKKNLRGSPETSSETTIATATAETETATTTIQLPSGRNITIENGTLLHTISQVELPEISRPWRMSASVAVGMFVMLGVLALVSVAVGLCFYKKSFPLKKVEPEKKKEKKEKKKKEKKEEKK